MVEFPEDKRADLHSRLLNEYYSLDCFPGAVELLQKLKVILTEYDHKHSPAQAGGFKVAILSNGSQPMLDKRM